MKKIASLFACLFIAVLAVHAQSTTFRFSMSSDGTGLKIDKYTGDSQYVVIQAYYDGLPVKEIGDSAFYRSNIISVSIPDTVVYIGHMVFQECTNLTTATLPRDLKYLGYYAFDNCKNLSSLLIKTVNPITWWHDDYGYPANVFRNCSNLPMSTQIQLIKLGYKGKF